MKKNSLASKMRFKGMIFLIECFISENALHGG